MMRIPNQGVRPQLLLLLILILILLPPLIMVLSIGTPKTRREAFISCSEQTQKRLIKSLKNCQKLPSTSKKKRCRARIKNLRAQQRLSCKDHLIPAELPPTPTPPPITQPCIATSPETWKNCLAEVNAGNRYMIEIANTIECSGPDTCAGMINGMKGLFEIKIYSKKGTNYGFFRRDNYDYSILTILNSEKIRLSDILFDDDIRANCSDCSKAVITVQESKKITFEEITIANAKAYGVAGYSLLESSFRMSNFINIGNTAIWLPFFRLENVLSMDVDLFANLFIGCRSHGIFNQGMGRPERISSFMYNTFIANGNGITLVDPARLIAVEHNIISDGVPLGGGGNGILALTEKGAEPNAIHDIYLRNNVIFNNAGWAVLKVSKRNPKCFHIIEEDNLFKDNLCRGDGRCEELSGYLWDCNDAHTNDNHVKSTNIAQHNTKSLDDSRRITTNKTIIPELRKPKLADQEPKKKIDKPKQRAAPSKKGKAKPIAKKRR